MKTEITTDRLSEYFYPSKNFYRGIDNVMVDYAEIEINPSGIKKLEDNLERCTTKSDEEWVKELNNPNSDKYEHIIAYVHFDAGTDNFNKMFIEVVSSDATYDDVLNVAKLINEDEKQNIITAALESIHKGRKTGSIIEQEGRAIEAMLKKGSTEATDSMTVREFCLRHTQVGELIVFRKDEYVIGTTWIDHEDLFVIPESIAEQTVKSDSWWNLPITTEHGDKIEVPCHAIDF